jgi:hypothetical protein
MAMTLERCQRNAKWRDVCWGSTVGAFQRRPRLRVLPLQMVDNVRQLRAATASHWWSKGWPGARSGTCGLVDSLAGMP